LGFNLGRFLDGIDIFEIQLRIFEIFGFKNMVEVPPQDIRRFKTGNPLGESIKSDNASLGIEGNHTCRDAFKNTSKMAIFSRKGL